MSNFLIELNLASEYVEAVTKHVLNSRQSVGYIHREYPVSHGEFHFVYEYVLFLYFISL